MLDNGKVNFVEGVTVMTNSGKPSFTDSLGRYSIATKNGDSVYFAGDMFYPSGMGVSELEVAMALLPVGGFYTFGPEEAVAFAKSFKKIGKVLPMHYHKNPETKEEFIKLNELIGKLINCQAHDTLKSFINYGRKSEWEKWYKDLFSS